MKNVMRKYRRLLKLIYSRQHTLDQETECSFWHPLC